MADVPCQSEFGAFQQIFDGPFLISPKAVCVFDGNDQIGTANPFFAERPEFPEGIQIDIEISVVHLYLSVRKRNMNPMVHMHIDHQRLAFVPIPFPQGHPFFRGLNGPLHRFQIRVRNKGIEIRDIEILVQMNGIIQPRFLRRSVKFIAEKRARYQPKESRNRFGDISSSAFPL